MQFVFFLLCGALVAAANLLQTLSGSVVAVGLDIYERLIHSINPKRGDMKQSLSVLIPAFFGGCAVLLFLRDFFRLLTGSVMPISFFAIGLILGSLPALVRKLIKNKLIFSDIIAFIVGAFLIIMLTFYRFGKSDTLLFSPSIFSAFFCAAIVGIGMLLPGAAGMLICGLMGISPLLVSLSEQIIRIQVLCSAALGAVIGLLIGARLLDLCFKRFPSQTYFALLGMMITSIIPLYINSDFTLNIKGSISIATLMVGMTVTLLMEKLRDFFKNRSHSHMDAAIEV